MLVVVDFYNRFFNKNPPTDLTQSKFSENLPDFEKYDLLKLSLQQLC